MGLFFRHVDCATNLAVLTPPLPSLEDHDLWEVLEQGMCLLQLIQDFLAILGLWHFHTNLSQFINFQKENPRITSGLHEICGWVWGQLGSEQFWDW